MKPCSFAFHSLEICWVFFLYYVGLRVLPEVEEPSFSVLETISPYLYICESLLVMLVTFVGKRTYITKYGLLLLMMNNFSYVVD